MALRTTGWLPPDFWTTSEPFDAAAAQARESHLRTSGAVEKTNRDTGDGIPWGLLNIKNE